MKPLERWNKISELAFVATAPIPVMLRNGKEHVIKVGGKVPKEIFPPHSLRGLYRMRMIQPVVAAKAAA